MTPDERREHGVPTAPGERAWLIMPGAPITLHRDDGEAVGHRATKALLLFEYDIADEGDEGVTFNVEHVSPRWPRLTVEPGAPHVVEPRVATVSRRAPEDPPQGRLFADEPAGAAGSAYISAGA